MAGIAGILTLGIVGVIVYRFVSSKNGPKATNTAFSAVDGFYQYLMGSTATGK